MTRLEEGVMRRPWLTVIALALWAAAAPGLFIFRDEARQWLDRLAGASKPGS